MSLTKIFLTCNSFAHSQNNKADTKHPQYLSMILVFLCEMPISRRFSGVCKSEKNEMFWKDLYILWIFYCLWFDLKVDSGFPDRFLGKPWRSQRGSQKGEQKGGATRGSFQFCFIFNKESPPSFKYKMKSFLKKGLFS